MISAIHHMKTEDRPRERLQLFGAAALSDQELLAIILGSGTSRQPVLLLAEQLLDAAKHFSGLSQLHFDELCETKGIGPAKAAVILAACEIGRRAILPEAPKIYIRTGEDAIRHFRHRFRQDEDNKYIIVLLDRQKSLLASAELAPGRLPPDLQQVLKIVSESGAHGFGLLRNSYPDEDQYHLVEQLWLEDLRAAAGLLRLKFYSHLIVPT